MSKAGRWSVNEVRAFNDYDVVSSNNATIPTGWQTIWNNNRDWNDGADGSAQPVVLHNPFTSSYLYCRITVSGTAEFPASWNGGWYVLAGYLKGKLAFHGGFVRVPTDENKVHVNGLYLASADFKYRQVAVPFRLGGDFAWYIWLYKKEQWSDYMAPDSKSRLEVCWTRASYPTGPLTATSSAENTRVDMSPGYPILLFRLFAPPPSELPESLADDVQSYIKRAITRVIWNPNIIRPRYDTFSGAPFYGVSIFGGGFMLEEWYKGTYSRCNCYDVAGISQLACSLLMDSDGNEIVDSRWVFHLPSGFINPGPLIRWVKAGGDNLRCNNPFWKSNDSNPYVDPDSGDRTSFGNHAWVEISLSGKRGVLDACHALQATTPVPPVGEWTREEYIDKTLDQNKPHGDATTNTGDNGGACSLNPDTQLERIGVYNPFGKSVPMSTMLPEPLKAEIDAFIEDGRTQLDDSEWFNVAKLNPHDLKSNLDAGYSLIDSKVSVFDGTVNTTCVYQNDAKRVIFKIDLFDDSKKPKEALIKHLAGIQMRPLSSALSAGKQQLGTHCFCGKTEAVWIMGNMFIRVMDDSDGPTGNRLDLDIPTSLNTYIMTYSDIPPFERLALADEKTTRSVKIGDTLRVSLGPGTPLSALVASTSFSSDSNVLVPRGVPDEEGNFVFYPKKIGKVEVTVAGAAEEALRPVKTSFSVVVEDDGAGELKGPTVGGDIPDPSTIPTLPGCPE